MVLGLCLPFAVLGCRTASPSALLAENNAEETRPGPRFCAAIRGNGNFIFTHFGALSRVLEEFGEIDGMAGGSSASVTTFFYESMRQNPALPPEGPERQAMLSLMMKSAYGYALVLGNSEEAQALTGLANIGTKVREQGLLSLVTVNWIRAGLSLKKILEAPDVREMVNPEALKILANIDRAGFQNYRFKVQELIKTASAVGGFEAKDVTMFFREPVVNYDGFVRIIGRVGNFYAGLDPVSNTLFSTFLKTCLSKNARQTWTQIASETVPGGTCGSLFAKAVTTYRSRIQRRQFVVEPAQDRMEQVLGEKMLTFIPAAILDGKTSVELYEKNLADYRQGRPATFPVSFKDVGFGYFTPFPSGTSVFASMQRLFPVNAKVAKGLVLNPEGAVTWREALRYSTMEPGLSRIVPVGSSRAYIGGWSDLHPTQILKAAGCEKIIYISRIGPETAFVTKQRSLANLPYEERYGVAEKLNMTPEEHRQLYFMENQDNAFNNSVKTADAVWCTDWDSALASETGYMFDHSYGVTPSQRGEYSGFVTGIALRDKEKPAFVIPANLPIIEAPLWGCHAP